MLVLAITFFGFMSYSDPYGGAFDDGVIYDAPFVETLGPEAALLLEEVLAAPLPEGATVLGFAKGGFQASDVMAAIVVPEAEMGAMMDAMRVPESSMYETTPYDFGLTQADWWDPNSLKEPRYFSPMVPNSSYSEAMVGRVAGYEDSFVFFITIYAP